MAQKVAAICQYHCRDRSTLLGEVCTAYIPLPDNDHRTKFFSSQEFTYDAKRDVYVCPAGNELRFDRPHSTERSRRYRARAKACNHCPLKAQCTTSKQGRSLCRSVDEACLDRVRAYQATEAYKKALRKRQVWVEPLFAEAKDWHGMRRFRLRRLWRVNCEALRIATGQNLKRLLKKRGWGRRPFPAEAMYASYWVLLHDLLILALEEWLLLMSIGSAYSLADAMRHSLLLSLVRPFSTGRIVMRTKCLSWPVPLFFVADLRLIFRTPMTLILLIPLARCLNRKSEHLFHGTHEQCDSVSLANSEGESVAVQMRCGFFYRDSLTKLSLPA